VEDKTNYASSDKSENIKFKVFTFEYLIKHILDYGEDQGESRVR
jgi:hypothetical protein